MDVLEYAFFVVFWGDIEDVFGGGVPGIREVFDFEGSVEELFFEFEAEDDVEVVGDFVGVDADGVAFDGVDGEVEEVGIDVTELVLKELTVAGFAVFPEGARAADLVFPEAALGFVDSLTDGSGEGGAEVFFGETLFVEAVAGLMDGAEEGVEGDVFVETSSHADVLAMAAHEGVGGAVHAAVRVVEPEFFCDFADELFLERNGKVLKDRGVGFDGGIGDLSNDREEVFFECREVLFDELGVEIGVMFIDGVVVGVGMGADEFSLLDGVVELFLEIWGEG